MWYPVIAWSGDYSAWHAHGKIVTVTTNALNLKTVHSSKDHFLQLYDLISFPSPSYRPNLIDIFATCFSSTNTFLLSLFANITPCTEWEIFWILRNIYEKIWQVQPVWFDSNLNLLAKLQVLLAQLSWAADNKYKVITTVLIRPLDECAYCNRSAFPHLENWQTLYKAERWPWRPCTRPWTLFKASFHSR